MISLLFLPLLLQDPAPRPSSPPAAVLAPDPRLLFSDWAKRLEKAPVVHLVAEGALLTADREKPDTSVRWTFSTEIWMAKGGRVNARTRWTGPRPEHGEPEVFTQIALANGKRTWQGVEGPEPLSERELAVARFVPYPLPEIFGIFDGKLEQDLPPAGIGQEFDWGEPVRSLPTAIVIDPKEPKNEPASWYGFAGRELGGWCTMMPERLGGDVVRGKLAKFEWLERLPEVDAPRFEPKKV